MNHPKPQSSQKQQAATGQPRVERDPRTGINKDMPSSTEEASGFQDESKRWGNQFCR